MCSAFCGGGWPKLKVEWLWEGSYRWGTTTDPIPFEDASSSGRARMVVVAYTRKKKKRDRLADARNDAYEYIETYVFLEVTAVSVDGAPSIYLVCRTDYLGAFPF